MANTSGKKKTAKKTTTGKKTVRREEPAPKQEGVSIADWIHAFSKTRVFGPVFVILVVAAVIFIDVLIAWNYYDRFYKILGFELLIIAVIWIFGLVMNISAPQNDKDRSEGS